MKEMLLPFFADDSGATAMEYGLLAALVSLASLVAYNFLAAAVHGIFSYIITSFVDAAT